MLCCWKHTWDDGGGDANGAAVLHKFEEAIHIIEELCDHHLSTSINLRTVTTHRETICSSSSVISHLFSHPDLLTACYMKHSPLQQCPLMPRAGNAERYWLALPCQSLAAMISWYRDWRGRHLLLEVVHIFPVVLVHLLRVADNDIRVCLRVSSHCDPKVLPILAPVIITHTLSITLSRSDVPELFSCF